MEYFFIFYHALVDLSNAMAPYILFGLFFAGILHEIVPDSLVTKHLGSQNIASVIKATLFGIPLPVCSCGVIPLATSIKKSGASKGATLSFLISTPITGIDSIMATYGIFGWVFMLYRVATSMLIAIVAGILTNIFDKEPPKPKFSFSVTQPAKSATCQTDACCCASSSEVKPKFSLARALRYSFGTLLKDIAKPLFWGLLLGAVISASIPQNLSDILMKYSWLSYLIIVIIAVPMYVCATASLPIAAAFMLSGVSAGAAFVFLSAGPATNTVTIGVVKKMLGTRSLYIYLATIVVGSVLFGLCLDYLLQSMDINPRSLLHLESHKTVLAMGSSIVLWAMVLYFLLKPYGKRFYQ